MSTPIMQQYQKIKLEYLDCLLFFRLGDFYEMFNEDAKIAAKELNITLTKRAHKSEDIPMAGVPFHTSEYYISKLVKAGYKVAICEQIGSELNKDKIIPREVVQVITAGTITNESMLEEKRNNFLISIEEKNLIVSIACFDISTNEFFVEDVEKINLKNALEKLDPSEILVNQLLAIQLKEQKINQNKITIIQQKTQNQSENIINNFFNLHSLKSLEYLNEQNKITIANILEYIKHTQKQLSFNIKLPIKKHETDEVQLDLFTRKNLEITKTLQNNFQGSLLCFIDQTETSQGGRKIYKHLTNPINNIEKLNQRYDNIEFFKKDNNILKKVKEILKEIPDFERILSKIILKKASPNQIYKLATGTNKLYELCDFLKYKIDKHPEIFNQILQALNEDAPNNINSDDSYINENYNHELDEYKNFLKTLYNQLDALQEKYQNQIKINNLRIKKTPLGFLVEINPSLQNKLDCFFELKQTLKNALRYSTKELDEINLKFLLSKDFIKNKEKELFFDLCKKIETIAEDTYIYSEISANIDVFSNLAQISNDFGYNRPILTKGNEFEIIDGKHPILEKHFKNNGQIFVENDCNLSTHIMLMTGPNMAGKSTYLRQQAIICLLAHCGMFVPCKKAIIGTVDKIFSRISTNDDLLQGNSTFMLEMIEMALTINQATSRSFLILDEVGRGTSVEEGEALARSILEYVLEKLNCRTIFATHYLSLGKINNLNLQKKMMKIIPNPLTFTYKLSNGVADKSYAIEVAKLAGMPVEIIQKAEFFIKNI
ncbi:DNA mismatch repair protein MutS [Alphaproteobacteria bacterium endosymbiont of Tiliacea citrago]|uniref:DNA mismatch repair protein MutS n=1 Tax=Alphaproteobacteria bacterium endosymbiont of Tiliacea citrago TaxID=3077944 RepID=UPI00313B0B56